MRHTRPVPTAPSSTDHLERLLGRGVREVWRDEDVWVLDKPPGAISHPNPPAKRAANALLCAEYDYERELYRVRAPGEKGVRRIWLVHRLDRETSGLILCALSEDAAARMKEALERREVEKEYRALVLGNPGDRGREGLSGEWHDHLERSRREGRVEVEIIGGRKPNATTGYAVVKRLPTVGVSLLALTPREGRTHQLRVQCARHGHPIAGDDRYGDFTANRYLQGEVGLKRMFLVAHRLAFRHPRTGKRMSFEAKLRPELAAVLERLEASKKKVPRKKQPRHRA
jgi:tRNA pseudouridine65 synthase